MSDMEEVARDHTNNAIKTLNNVLKVEGLNTDGLTASSASASVFTLAAISIHLDRIATALESKD